MKGGIAKSNGDARGIEGHRRSPATRHNAPSRKRIGIAGRASRGTRTAGIEVDWKVVGVEPEGSGRLKAETGGPPPEFGMVIPPWGIPSPAWTRSRTT